MYKINPRRKIKTVICLGQSNELGATNQTHSSQYLKTAGSFIFYKPDSTNTNNGVWQSYLFGKNNNYQSAFLNYASPQTSMAINYYETTNEPLCIIKYAYGGSGLVDNGVAVNPAGLWQIDANSTRANNLLHYNIALNNFIIPAINSALGKGFDLDIVSLLWTQGEADAQLVISSATYENEFKRMVTAMTTALSSYNVISPNFKPIITRIHNYFTPTLINQTNIRTALVNLATFYNSYWIDTDAYGISADNVHFSPVGYEQLGLERSSLLINHF